ncbi:hypothetical protein EHM92_00370 [bacterium]|nr:MAG: hypothetical protein EHM92_00370 [bacterium]
MKRHSFLLVSLSLILTLAASQLRSQSLVEVRLAADSVQPGFTKMALAHSSHSYFVAPASLLNLGDVDSASVWTGTSTKGQPDHAFVIHFKSSLTDSVRRLTKTNMHKRLAIIIDGVLVGTPRIINPLTSPKIPAPVPSLAEANKLASRVNRSLNEGH